MNKKLLTLALLGIGIALAGASAGTEAEQAVYSLRKAAQGGNAEAQYQLGKLYAMGYGAPKDYVLSYAMSRLAAIGEHEEAEKSLGGWDGELTDQQLAEGDALVAAWKKGDAFPAASRYGMQRKVNYVEDSQGKLDATPEVRALFKAASEGEEAEFIRLLGKVGNVNDYLVDDEKLLHALLLPAASLRSEADAWRTAGNNARDLNHWQAQQARHAALQPAKLRMLALALERGASIKEGTRSANAAALHLAAMFGTPDMIALLLKHGADPRQYGGENYQLAPLEFALEQKKYARGVPELISPAQRTDNILALLKAGAARPYIRIEENARKKDGGDKPELPYADYLLWPKVLGLTSGTDVLDALLKTGTRPAKYENEGKTSFDVAAEAGNADAIAWLKPRVPRYGMDRQDHWLGAAMLAMYSSAPGRDDVLRQLLAKGMDWNQSGPHQDSYGLDYRPLHGGSERIESGTLLNHATRARRAEWIPQLAALGAPVHKGGSVEDLLGAVRAGDSGMVQALLAQGADPLSGSEPALVLALGAPAGQDAILDLLLEHIVKVQKKSLADMQFTPLEQVLTGPDGIGVGRLRKLLDAGASAEGLSREAVGALFGAQDRSLAVLLIEHGLLGEVQAKPAPKGASKAKVKMAAQVMAAEKAARAANAAEPYFVFIAIREGRADLLPAILAHGENPNLRTAMRDGSVQPNAVEYAISQGQVEELNVLLAHGGVIDMKGGLPWGSPLDRAVASLKPEMLRLVSKNHTQPLNQVCLPLHAHLAKVVLEAPAAYWSLLREHGFGAGSACPGMQGMLALYLSESPHLLLEGWLGQQLVERLPQLGPQREVFDADLWAAIAMSKNDPLSGLLAKAGWVAPARAVVAEEAPVQTDKAADLALQPKLVGHYYLSGVREVGAEILLRPNGKFQYSMAYGAVDEYAQGSWTVWNQQLVFRSETAEAQPATMRPSTDAPAVKLAAGQVLVDLRHNGKSIPDFKVTVLGDLPQKVEGRTGGKGWRGAFSGPVRQIAVSHAEFNEGKWMPYVVAPGEAQRGSYQLDFQEPATALAGFNFTLDVRDGKLVLERQGREMLFEKH
ncbi:hypothetical protein HSX11_20440 [Oxalobacteraceae bacterium]|nr:hypothetical protein [Oxalobacteraceae bacterium]